MTILSAKRETFCLLVVSGKTLIEAYRQSRPAGVMDDQTASSRARELLKRPEILARIAELRLPAEVAVRRKYEYKLEHALHECDQAIALALALGQPSVMVSAIAVKAKIAGLGNEKRDEGRGILDTITTAELLRMRALLIEGRPARPVLLLGSDHLHEKKAEIVGGGQGVDRAGHGAPSTLNRD